MFIDLQPGIFDLLRCSHCKGPLTRQKSALACESCGTVFLSILVDTKESMETVFDFRIHHPAFAMPPGIRDWEKAQHHYMVYTEQHRQTDDLDFFLKQIDSVLEIYTREFSLSGAVLDVGGHQGRLRHFLSPADEPHYVSIDPMPEVFSGIGEQQALLEAYPALRRPCNFVAGSAENLPFAGGSFDWVHMRSVLDHFSDPYLALKEAWRVLKPGGRILIGLLILEKIRQPAPTPLPRLVMEKFKRDGLWELGKAVFRQLAAPPGATEKDEHLFRFKHRELIELMEKTGFNPEKEHWQKPPNSAVLYVSGQKQPAGTIP